MFLRRRLISSKLPEHALGLEVGGKRKGKCKPRSESLHSTSADAKLKVFPLYSTLIPGEEKKKKLRELLQSKLGWREDMRNEEAQGGVPQDSSPTGNKTDVNRAKSKCFREGKGGWGAVFTSKPQTMTYKLNFAYFKRNNLFYTDPEKLSLTFKATDILLMGDKSPEQTEAGLL